MMSESLAVTNPTSYDSVPLTDNKAAPTTVDNESNNTAEFTADGYAALKKYIAEGDINIKTVGLVAAAAMTLTGFISCIAHLFMLDLFQALLDAGTTLVGYACSAMEYKESILWPPITDYIHTELHVAVTPFGRSMIYIIMGVILLTQDSWFQGFMGIMIICLGFFNYVDMKSKIERLHEMKTQLTNEGNTLDDTLYVLISSQFSCSRVFLPFYFIHCSSTRIPST